MRLEKILRKKQNDLFIELRGRLLENISFFATRIATGFARNSLLSCRIKTMKPLKEVR